MSDLNREELAKYLSDFDEISGKQAAYIIRNFDPKTECYHLNVLTQRRLYAAETRFEPAEYEYKHFCLDCGEELDTVPEVANVKEEIFS
jgi:hypothetical protein